MAEIKQVKIGSTNYDIHAKVADSISGVTATTTELNYVDGVTSNIQTQLNTLADDIAIRLPLNNDGYIGLAQDTDLNTITTVGIYTAVASVGSKLINSPVTGGQKLIVMQGYSDARKHQFIFGQNTSNVFHRMYGGSSWTDWVNLSKTTLADLGITATAAELNYVDGVTSNIQTQLNDKAPKSHGIHYIEGTGDTAGTWLGTHADITEYYAGLILAYKIGVAGLSGGTTLNINNLGAVTVVKNATSAISTNFAVNSVIFLVYTIDSDGTAYWKAHDYDSNTKTTTGTSNKASTKLYLAGATSQSSSGATTYSNSKVYIGTDDCLYSNGQKVSTTDTNTTYTFATGSSNGTISVTPSGGTATNVAVKGLGSAAYTASTAYDAAGAATTALNNAKAYTDAAITWGSW